ncbi:hypothetical protein STAQ_50110 [Allostella sp. ATCC 35155]|nr:hypothetical protein STAQ_50110 [Stella sp. ATCC 35155]
MARTHRPPRWETLAAEGLARRRAGDGAGAIEAYRRAAAVAGAPAAVFFNLGNALFDAGCWADAEGPLSRAVALDPAMAAARMQRARCHARQGRYEEAIGEFAEVLRREPANFTACLEGGHALRQLGRLDAAIDRYRAAAAAAPARFEAQLALARALEEAGRPDEAARHYHRALPPAEAAGAGAWQVHWHMARYRRERGANAPALEALRQALLAADASATGADADSRARMTIDLADLLLRLGLRPEGLEAAQAAATSEATLTLLSDMLFRHNLWQEAQAVLEENLRRHPDSATACWNLAHLLAESWQLQPALRLLDRAEALGPQPGARAMRASLAARGGEAEEALRLYRELAEAEGGHSSMASSAAMASLYSDRLSAADVAALHRRLFAPLGHDARPRESFPNPRVPDRPLRIGFVTPDLHAQHPVAVFLLPVLGRLDRTRYAATIYCTGTIQDEETRKARERVARWVQADAWTDIRLAAQIAADGIDLLVDLSGHTARNRKGLFGQRAAPVQATFLGYPGSTGIPNMDWIVADPVVVPEHDAALCSERVLRLPHAVFCFAPEDDYPLPDFGRPAAVARPLTFGSFNNLPKLTPTTVRLWAAVLAALPEARLLLKAPSFQDGGAAEHVRGRFWAAGVAPERIECRGPTGLEQMMAEYADVDIALDPVPYNGGTTTLQALWMGVPVVARRGENFVSRMGASFLTAAGLDDWVAEDEAAYVRIAARMAADRPRLVALKAGLRQRLLGRPAWDIARYTEDLQGAFRAMWRDACGIAP